MLKRLSIELPYYPAILLLGIYPRDVKNICPHKNMYINVQSSIVHNSQKVKQPNVRKLMDKYNVSHPCNEEYYSATTRMKY